MKTLRLIGMGLFAILMCVNFAACGDNDEIHEGQTNEYGLPMNVANNIIYYKTTDNQALDIDVEYFGSNIGIKSNTYSISKGYGTIEFKGDLTTIDDYDLDYETLEIISFPASLNKLGKLGTRSTSLRAIIVDNNNTCYSSHDGCLYDKKQKTIIRCPINKLDVVLLETVTTIGNSAFEDCSLTDLIIPNNVTLIESNAFFSCENLKSITLSSNLTKIGAQAFCFCKSLQSITIPENVNYIGFIAFEGCSSLSQVYCKPTTPPTLETLSAPERVFVPGTVYVPAESIGKYRSDAIWKKSHLQPYKF